MIFFLSVWCFINIKGINHPKIKIGLCFIFRPSFTHSKVVLNLNEFHKHYFDEGGKPNSCWSTVTYIFFPTVKVNVDQQLFGYPNSSKYLLLCSTQERNEYRFGTTCEWINTDRNNILGWTIPLMTVGSMFNTVSLACTHLIYRHSSISLSTVYLHFRHN